MGIGQCRSSKGQAGAGSGGGSEKRDCRNSRGNGKWTPFNASYWTEVGRARSVSGEAVVPP